MPKIKILIEAELRDLVPLDEDAIDCVEQAFAALAGGKVVMPPILSLTIPDHDGEVCIKTAYVPGYDSFAVKMSPGFFNNPALGLPSTSGLLVLFASHTGLIEALLLDNGYLTDVRTAAAGAVAARHLARTDAAHACIVGAGIQAKMQLKALMLVRAITRATIWTRDAEKAAKTAEELARDLLIDVVASDDLQASVIASDIIITTTPSDTPLISAEWLGPGHHITAVGSDQEYKCELDPACLQKATRYVPDSRAQCAIRGELRSAIASGRVAADQPFPEIGDITSGRAPGRQAAAEITIADLTGTGVQDTAIATLARQRAEAAQIGANFTS